MKKHSLMAIATVATMAMVSCTGKQKVSETLIAGLSPEKFAAEVDGKPTALYSVKSSDGMEAAITNYGGRIVALQVPDRNGEMRDVVLGFDSIQAYLPENNQTDFGAAIGRYANRIDHGRIVIDGDSIQLPVNNFGHTLHGGPTGWQYQVYSAEQPNDSTLVLSIDSPDGDNGFPGNVKATVTYTALPGNKLDIAYSATTDRATVINMTNHSYFNLSGDPMKPITDHTLYVYASNFTPV
ncbi:aldose epimerase family protein, partial [uncultured Duncaniella sp.]